MSTLYLLSNMFPFGDVEPYLENEVRFYNKFDRVFIFALQIHEDQFAREREVGSNVTVIPIKKASNWKYAINLLNTLFDQNLYKEFNRLIISGRFSIETFIKMLVYFSRSHYEAKKIDKRMKNKVEKDSIFYSYRFEYQPYVAVILKKKWKLNSPIVSRAHGYDLYEEVNRGKYIPMREGLLHELSKVYPCSKYGTEYLVEKFPAYTNKISPRYLGTQDHGIETKKDNECFSIVSCSHVIEIKRIHLIVEALSKIKGARIEWTHYGDGRLLEQISVLAKEMLPANIKYNLQGNLDNTKLMSEYKTHYYHVFINVSESEGLPVSIMEAMSFGIPCIATDVGGTHEIVNEKNGFLLSSNPSVDEISSSIEKMFDLDEQEYLKKRKQARLDWESKFSCDNNYREFIDQLIEMTSFSHR